MPGHQLCFLGSVVKSAKTKEVLQLLELMKMQILFFFKGLSEQELNLNRKNLITIFQSFSSRES